PGHDSLLAWTMVRAEAGDPRSVLEALAAGAHYATTGARLADVQVTEDAVVVECSPASAVTLRSGPWDGGRANADPRRMSWRAEVLDRDPSGAITRARLRLPEQRPWGRVEVLGADGTRAWTNPQALPLDPMP